MSLEASGHHWFCVLSLLFLHLVFTDGFFAFCVFAVV